MCLATMAGKLFVALFVLLAVQGWTSAGVIPDEFMNLLESGDFTDLKAFEDLSWEDLTKVDIGNKKAEDCVPYIPEAYSTAKAVQKIIGEAKELGKKLKEAAKKCKALSNADEKNKCYQELKKKAKTEGKPIYEAYQKVRTNVIQSMANFDKCMA